MQKVVDVDFRPKLDCAFILKLYDAQCGYYQSIIISADTF